jgi:regulator of Ty1 transposition protein 103
MKKCIEKLKAVEKNRAAIVFELKEALQEQVRTTWIFSS